MRNVKTKIKTLFFYGDGKTSHDKVMAPFQRSLVGRDKGVSIVSLRGKAGLPPLPQQSPRTIYADHNPLHERVNFDGN